MRVGLIKTGLADPRSESGPHQFVCQSSGWKNVGDVRVGLSRTMESLMDAPLQGIALPVAKKTLWEELSTSTPPAAHTLSALEGVLKTLFRALPAVGTPTTYP